ncbi:prepilin peptidase [Alienimonas sp. DA493]|uniref:A24 family peptidase n=1 Tax=Alienimonas sp. DA493 TaxID=3373605 RepID=UPI0037551FE3
MNWTEITAHLAETWPVWLVTVLTLYATWIDVTELRVPNRLTYPMILAGMLYNATFGEGWVFGVTGMLVGLATLMPLYAVGGMGSGDVKLMAGIGAWLGTEVILTAFVVTAIVGAVIAIGMACWGGEFKKHFYQSIAILSEWKSGMSLREISEAAAERKPRMKLLPYGLPICIGSLGYFAYAGMY